MDNKKRILMFVQAVKLADEVAGLDRAAYIANMLQENGYDVTLATSAFQHWEKKQRDTNDEKYKKLPYNVVFLEEPGYNKNIDLERVKSHDTLNKSLIRYLRDNGEKYDLYWVQIPPNNLASTLAEYANQQKKPFIVDINDLWPEAMKMVINIPIISNILFHSFDKDARTVYRNATACVATSNEYAKRPLSDRQGLEDIDRRVVYVGGDLKRFDAGVNKYSSTIDKPNDELWITYAGTLGKSYDISTLITATDKAAVKIEKDTGKKTKLLILGDGPDRASLESLANKTRNIETKFYGYIEYELMAAYLSKSDILVNSLVHGAPQSIVSKIGDYLAAGKPMINTGESREFRSKVLNDGFGRNVAPEDEYGLSETIIGLARDTSMRKIMSAHARAIAEEQFDRATAYKQIVELVDKQLAVSSLEK